MGHGSQILIHNFTTGQTGKLADLILVDGDPLVDIAVLQQYQAKIVLIMQRGRVYKNQIKN